MTLPRDAARDILRRLTPRERADIRQGGAADWRDTFEEMLAGEYEGIDLDELIVEIESEVLNEYPDPPRHPRP
jgi:hypothetical protein